MLPNKLKMKAISIINSLLLVALICTGLIGGFYKSEKVAYLDTGVLLNGYKGMQDASADFQKQKAVWQANVDTLTSELQFSIAEHEKNFSQMSDKEKQLSTELLERKRQEYYQYQQAMEQKAREEDQKITSQVIEEVNVFVKEYGANNGYKIILGTTGNGNLMYAAEGLNLTEDVLAQLNERYAK